MNNDDIKKLLPSIENIARAAGAEIMTHYAGTQTYTKDDGSEVTDADHAAEHIILTSLRALTPHIPIVSEERVAAGEIPDVSGGTFWTVDPLDGTREFINRTGAFVVAIALLVDRKPVMGIIYHPAMDLLYSSAGADTAFRTGPEGGRMPLIGAAPAGDLRVLVNEQHTDMERVKTYLDMKAGIPARIDARSGILRACQVAEGLAHMAIVCTKKTDGRVAWWDVAAGHAIVESAGGRLETLEEGAPLCYDASDLHVPPHIVIGITRVSDASPE